MASFCKYCGTSLEEGPPCPCPEAAADRTEQAQQQANPNMDKAKDIAGEVKFVLANMGKNPAAAAKNSGEMSFGAALAILGVEVLSVLLLVWGMAAKIKALFHAVSAWGPTVKIPFSLYIYVIFGTALSTAVLFFALFLVGKLFRSTLDTQGLLSTMASASIPRTAGNLVMMVVILVLGMEGNLSVYLLLLVSTFCVVMSYFLQEVGMRRLVPEKTNNMLIIAIAYALRAAVVFFIFSVFGASMLEDVFADMFSMLRYFM